MKICSTCRIGKELIDFGKNKSAKDGLQNRCKLCRKQYSLDNADKINKKTKQWQINNAEHIKQYYIDNAEKIKQQHIKYTMDNPEYKKQWRKNNAEHIKQYGKQRRIDNPDYIKQYRIDNDKKIKQSMKEYCQTLHGKLVYKASAHKRRILKLKNTPSGNHFTADDIILKLKLQHGKCIYCQNSIKKYYEIDHIMPLCKGGSNESNNIQLLCKNCNGNGGKGSKLPYEYAQKHGKLL